MVDFCVRVPATTANLGPGFDVFGLALDLHDEFFVGPSAELHITVEGEGERELARDAENLFVRAFRRAWAAKGEEAPPLRLHMVNRVPLFRGLGSSTCAVVGGLLAANHMLGNPFSRLQLLQLAKELEGHPDNAAAALHGGFVVCTVNGVNELACATLPFPADLHIVLCIPDEPLPTELSRRVVPRDVPMRDAVYNVGHGALLLSGILQRREDLIRVGMRDRLHQPYRGAILHALEPVMEAALAAGACGSALSGAGSTILALTFREPERVATAMRQAAEEYATPSRMLVLPCALDGAVVIPVSAGVETR